MKNPILFTSALWLFGIFVHSYSISAQSNWLGAIYPGVPWLDNNGDLINAHGAGFIKVGSTYYMIGEKRTLNTFPINGDIETKFVGMNMYSSNDLVNWNFVSLAVQAQAGTSISTDNVVERPKILYNAATNKYVCFMHTWLPKFEVGVATSTNIEGPYIYLTQLKNANGNNVYSGDLTAFPDTDGKGYVITNSGYFLQLSNDFTSVVATVAGPISSGSEAPAVFKKGNTYYYFCSESHWWHSNPNYYYTAPSISGPWTGKGDIAPGGTSTFHSQTTFVLPVYGSDDTTFIYMGDRWCNAYQLASSYIWQPLNLDGSTLPIPSYHTAWNIDVKKGAWSDISESGISINDAVTGSSQNQFNYFGTWTKSSCTGCLANDHTYSNKKDDSVTIAFTGTQIKLYATVDPSHGVMGITLTDNNNNALTPEMPLDLYNGDRQGNYLVYVSPVKPSGSYKLRIRVTGSKNGYSGGAYGSIDRVLVMNDNPTSSAGISPTRSIPIYPNPIKDGTLIIDLSALKNSQFCEVKVIDIHGRAVLQEKVNASSSFGLNTSSLQKGMYFLTIKNEEELITEKFTIE